jgi:dTDP-4-amino-4,6-dideoxygalactose transaminase
MDNAVLVTQALVPDREEYLRHLDAIFASRALTNNGPCCRKLEQELARRLRTPWVRVCANGTLALQLAVRRAGMAGKEVITTPFSYAATVSALLCEGCTPVFADIDEETLCLDPKAVAGAIRSRTGGILPVHAYGNICDVDALAETAKAASLPLVYDAAPCFGGEFRGRSVLDYGDYAASSFHATKIFHTVEGGCVVCRAPEGAEAISLMRANGHRDDTHLMPGMNAKMSELHAAVGLCLLDKAADNIAGRKKVSAVYDALLPERGLRRPVLRPGLTYNHAYYPVIFNDEKTLLRARKRLNAENIFPRRYYYPSLNALPYIATGPACPVAESVAPRALCLPLYMGLEEAIVAKITRIIARAL